MATDPFAQDSQLPTSSLPTLGGGSSSLAQSARLKQLNVAKWILFILGGLTIAVHIGVFVLSEQIAREETDKSLKAEGLHRNQVDQQLLREHDESAVRAMQLAAGGFIALGVVYIVAASLIKTYPVPATVTSLVLFISANVLLAVFDPSTIVSGIILKIIVFVVLVKAVQAAIAYQKEKQSQPLAGFAV